MGATQTDLVRGALAWLARDGVREVCVAAGARNAPVVATLARCQNVTIRHFFEERCAGFFALGRIMATRRPVAVVTTSGTAAAELLPAMIEAHYQGHPLIAVTADRPKSYRGTGAPQAIEQAALYGPYAGTTLDVDAESPAEIWDAPVIANRPVHLNLCLDEPLDSEIAGIDFSRQPDSNRELSPGEPDKAELLKWFDAHPPDVVVAAGLHPDDAAELAPALSSLHLPIFAEATANLGGFRDLTHLLVPPTEPTMRALQPTSILRIGGVPSGRWWRDLEENPGVAVLNLTPTGFPGLARTQRVATGRLSIASIAELLSPARANRAGHNVAVEFPPAPPVEAIPNEKAWLVELSARIPDQAVVFLGNSLPIREWNQAVGSSRAHRVFANRGANGIDGLVSTFLGLSAEESESWLILGDLSALYDLAAPWILPQLPPGKRRIVVLNNGGGRIFSKVASLGSLPGDIRNIIENEHAISFAPWARLWNLPHRLAESPEDLSTLPDGAMVIEIVTQA